MTIKRDPVRRDARLCRAACSRSPPVPQLVRRATRPLAHVTCHAVAVSSLPPGPTEPPALQTARWLLRPISFLERCRRRYGDAFSIAFLGFQTPMVMLSNPAAIRALYSERGHGLPPGRTVSLRPIMGARSVLLLEGAEHMARRRVMLPPFHGDRMRAYEPIVRETTRREIARGRATRRSPCIRACRRSRSR